MASLKHDIETTHKEFSRALDQATTLEALEQIRITFLGRNGSIANIMAIFKQLPIEEKRAYGPLLQELKKKTQELFDAKKITLESQAHAYEEKLTQQFDVTAYKSEPSAGTLHPYSSILEEIENVFISMGFTVTEGPEVETDYRNFEALNIPKDHPARDMQDTFWIDVPGLLMRTHTSTVQIKTMESQQPPIAILASGRVYRHEATDASHDYMFVQTEGLVVDKNISVANLFATTETFLQAIFRNKSIKTRVRPGYFPFVEPGIEIDMSCPFCTTGCSVCKKTTWIEAVGAGLVHPNVLRMSGIDPDVYSGFAFGFGTIRLTMLRHGINDIRLLHSNKLDFLRQF
ncbi:phenylalanine--tRNA ligase subunit alpha [Candidatus Babeliales bacterium]|nr:phenylalanine--tRNA ligase subunit alpha [Candidatus Babeliales bacterium]